MSNTKLKGHRDIEMFIFFTTAQILIILQAAFAVMVFQLHLESSVTFAINGVCITFLLENLHCVLLRLYI